jgi:hypothetical protein
MDEYESLEPALNAFQPQYTERPPIIKERGGQFFRRYMPERNHDNCDTNELITRINTTLMQWHYRLKLVFDRIYDRRRAFKEPGDNFELICSEIREIIALAAKFDNFDKARIAEVFEETLQYVNMQIFSQVKPDLQRRAFLQKNLNEDNDCLWVSIFDRMHDDYNKILTELRKRIDTQPEFQKDLDAAEAKLEQMIDIQRQMDQLSDRHYPTLSAYEDLNKILPLFCTLKRILTKALEDQRIRFNLTRFLSSPELIED